MGGAGIPGRGHTLRRVPRLELYVVVAVRLELYEFGAMLFADWNFVRVAQYKTGTL